jgi:sugar O-acyltransferase (sialic acid O-acetyltransferase NeuD family)
VASLEGSRGTVVTESAGRATRLVVIGAGGHAAEVCSYVRDVQAAGSAVQLLGCVDDHKPAGHYGQIEVLGGLSELEALLRGPEAETLRCLTAVGDNAVRKTLVERVDRLIGRAARWWTLRHPSALVGADVSIGAGSCLAPGAIATTRLTVGAHVILNVRASISHDGDVGDYANINPGATVAGSVQIGEGCFVGAGATVIQRVALGAWSVIGAGAVVVRDVPPRVTVVGVPGRVIRQH